jgi:hypothetical protein
MFKQLTLALVGLVATASADHVSHQMDPFRPANFFQAGTPVNLLTNFVKDVQGKVLKDGHVVFSSCDSGVAGLFVLDQSQTYAQPDPATKGITVALNLGGIFTKATTLSNLDINTLWDDVPLHKEDHALTNSIPANGPFSYTATWYIPPFAPSGHYHNIITITGTVSGQSGAQSVACVQADFDL